MAYDFPHSGEVIILKINQAIHIDTMCDNLLCNMQLRMDEVKLFECPKYLTDNPSELDHTIFITPVDEVDNDFIIPLSLSGSPQRNQLYNNMIWMRVKVGHMI